MQKNIAIVMGGYSSEYNISLQSGNVVYANIDIQNTKDTEFIFSKKNGFILLMMEVKFQLTVMIFQLLLMVNTSYLMVFLTQFMAVLEKMVICKPTLHY